MVQPGARKTTGEAEEIARAVFGIEGSARSLASYADQNFHLRTETGQEFVLKLAHEEEDERALEAQNGALLCLAEAGLGEFVPHAIPSVEGREIVAHETARGGRQLVRLVSFLEGTVLGTLAGPPPELFEDLGRLLGRVDQALLGFEHEGARRLLKWDLARALDAHDKLGCIPAAAERACAARQLARFEADVLPLLGRLPKSVIHNDANDDNVLVRGTPGGALVIRGLIDFGDLVWTCTVFEVAIAMTYAMLGPAERAPKRAAQNTTEPLSLGAAVLRGYSRERTLSSTELELLPALVRTRLAVSVIHAAEGRQSDPENAYVNVSEARAWRLLTLLESSNEGEIHRTFRAAIS